ncbi:hypothetical protein SAMD00019534_023240, partial [Acytostelium subglobosum LB1]|uniref:hypothetical protein n=1 Tax=Acytostelium subglobosum LB1 TaxID=1410327 RepID=UPI0006451026
MLCIDCKQLVCSSCAVIDHKKHDLDCVDVIKELINEKKCNDMFDKRLQLLWTSVQEQAATYKSLNDTRKQINDHFKELHEFLIIEEHKLVSPITQQINETQSSIDNIIDEIRDISALFNLSTNANSNDKNNNEEAEQDVTIIQSCTSVREYIDKTCTALTSKDIVTCSDHQLLNQLIESVARIESMPECPVIDRFLKVTLQADGLNLIKKQVQLAYSLSNVTDPNEGQLKEHRVGGGSVFSYGPTVSTLFDPRTGASREINNNGVLMNNVTKCAVYAKDHIYFFGQVPQSTVCSIFRYSMATQLWTTHQLDSILVLGGYPMACYDGNSTIYLIGKYSLRNSLVALNIDTLHLDVVQRKFTSGFERHRIESLYYYNDYLYAITHCHATRQNFLWSINCKNQGETRLVDNDVPIERHSSSYDGKGKIYFYNLQSGIVQCNLDTRVFRSHPLNQLPQLDTMLYFININSVLLNGKLVRCPDRPVDHDNISCLIGGSNIE